MKRRDFLKAMVASGAMVGGGVVFLRRAYAQDPVKIGVPTTLSGGAAEYGIQVKRACELFAQDIKKKGGILGRPVQFIYEDTAYDPATAVRKAQKLVEKDGVKFITGVVSSSEALAVSAKCPEWQIIFMSTVNGAGSLTAKAWNRYFFRANVSSPMCTRGLTLYLQEAPMKRFFAMGSDFAWGRESVASFSKQVAAMGKEVIGTDFPPVGTKDFASYIAKVRQSGADACYSVFPGQDGTIFFRQASQFGLTRQVKMLVEILEMEVMKPAGDAMEGVIGASRYPFTIDTPRNHDFVKRFHAMHSVYPDMFDGQVYQGVEWLAQTIQKAGIDDVEKVITAWEDSSYDGFGGQFFMRKCDHQAMQPVFVAQAVKDPKYPHLIPKVLATYSGEKATPKCRSDQF